MQGGKTACSCSHLSMLSPSQSEWDPIRAKSSTLRQVALEHYRLVLQPSNTGSPKAHEEPGHSTSNGLASRTKVSTHTFRQNLLPFVAVRLTGTVSILCHRECVANARRSHTNDAMYVLLNQKMKTSYWCVCSVYMSVAEGEFHFNIRHLVQTLAAYHSHNSL